MTLLQKIIRRINHRLDCLETQEKRYKSLETEWQEIQLVKDRLSRDKTLQSIEQELETNYNGPGEIQTKKYEKWLEKARKNQSFLDSCTLEERQLQIGFSLTYGPGQIHGVGKPSYLTIVSTTGDAAKCMEEARKARRRLRRSISLLARLAVNKKGKPRKGWPGLFDIASYGISNSYKSADFRTFANWLKEVFDNAG